MQGARQYAPPIVRDYGDLATITASTALLGVATSQDLSFSSPGAAGAPPDLNVAQQSGSGAGTAEVPTAAGGGPDAGSGGVGGVGTTGGGEASGGPAGGGGSLPFTGFAAGAVALVGSGIAVAGRAMRRAARRV